MPRGTGAAAAGGAGPEAENAQLLPRLDLFAAGFLGLARGADDRNCGRLGDD
jgi:hypothetical protein